MDCLLDKSRSKQFRPRNGLDFHHFASLYELHYSKPSKSKGSVSISLGKGIRSIQLLRRKLPTYPRPNSRLVVICIQCNGLYNPELFTCGPLPFLSFES